VPRTPDRRPGAQFEDDAILFEDRVSDIDSANRGLYRKGGSIYARDSTGVFNIRQAAGGTDNRYLIFKIDGGLVYDSNGDFCVKENDT
jgi:hypothetical protein